MTVIIGGRQTILNQIPEDLRNLHPRLSKPLDDSECGEMLNQALALLADPSMQQSHILFSDVVRLIIALQLSVAEAAFEEAPENLNPGKLNFIL